jgi:Secretion system C-terminal sorting domain
MSKLSKLIIPCIIMLFSLSVNAQLSTAEIAPGIWQTFGEPLSKSQYPEMNGRLCNFLWKDLEVANNVWDWTAFDKDLTDRTKDGLPLIFMVYTKQDAPEWIYNEGVSKVAETDNNGKVLSYSPYFADPEYKSFFKRMIQKVRSHVETLAPAVRSKIIGVQGCFGSTGDYISYDGNVSSQYVLDSKQFLSLFQEFSQYYYDEYKNTSPKIYLLSNPRNQGSDAAIWVTENCPGWIKTGSIGKAFQLNDESDKVTWLYNMLNVANNGEYTRARSEMSGKTLSTGWWKKAPSKNLFAVMCYDIFWGIDWNNQGYSHLKDPNYDSTFRFFNKYAGQKNAAKSTNAMCALKDVLDASDAVRFPAGSYGTVSQTNQQRYLNIVNKFTGYGALLEDVKTATLAEMDNLNAKGTNDVGWKLLPGNYDRYLHQLIANETSAGYWNIQSADINTMYGKFGRGFDVVNNKKALYFNLEDAFLSNAVLNGKYSVTIEITYLDKGTGGWQLYYDAQNSTDKSSINVTCNNTNLWKKATVTLNDAYFGNRGPNASDFSVRSTSNSQNVIFSVVELTRPSSFTSKKAAAVSNNLNITQNDDFKTPATLLINPNPVTSQFYIQMRNSELITQVVIYNQAGRVLLQKQVSGLRIAVNRNDLGGASGIYFIKVNTASGSYSGMVTLL